MNHGSNTIFEPKLDAFALPASLDRPPMGFDLADLKTHQIHDSLNVLDVLGPVLTPNATDVMLFADPAECAPVSSCSMATPRRMTKFSGTRDSTSPRAHKHHPKKASRKQVHELQAMVNTMQVQVDGAAAEIQQLAQLVEQFAEQRAQNRRHAAERQQLLEEHEMDMDLGTQQRHLQAQVEREQLTLEQHQQWQQEISEGSCATFSN